MEALVLFLVPLIALAVWLVARFQPGLPDAAADAAQREQHIAWLEDRLVHARRHQWDEQMLANLHAQLAEARERQARRTAA